MPSSSTSRRRRLRRGAGEEAWPSSADWAELPTDALLAVLHRLDPVELLLGGAARACRSWRRAARDEPALWRRVDMRLGRCHAVGDLRGAARAAVLRAGGRCEAFWGEVAVDDDFLGFLAGQAPLLKSLRLLSCDGVSNEGLMEAIQKFPMLEELELSLCKNIFGEVYEVIGKVCPNIKRFRVSHFCFYSIEDGVFNKDEEALGIATMCELRSLQLFGSELTNVGMSAILDNCPHLEYLDIRHCYNIYIDATLRAKCAKIKTLKHPHDSTDDYEFQFGNPIRTRSSTTRQLYQNRKNY